MHPMGGEDRLGKRRTGAGSAGAGSGVSPLFFWASFFWASFFWASLHCSILIFLFSSVRRTNVDSLHFSHRPSSFSLQSFRRASTSSPTSGRWSGWRPANFQRFFSVLAFVNAVLASSWSGTPNS